MPRSKAAKLSPRYLLPPSPQLTRYLLRLSKTSLEKLVFDWLKTPICAPDLTPTEEDMQYEDNPEDATLEQVEEAYRELKSRKDMVERVFEREWRNGLTMHQVAQVDIQYLLDHPSSQKWTACDLVMEEGKKPRGDKLPKFQPVVFCKSLIEIMDPMVQCHPYYISHPTLPLTIVRLSLHNPHPLPSIPPPTNQIFYLAVPDSSPNLFFTPQRSKLADVCRESLPIALSSQHRRYDLVSAALTAKTLDALVARKGHQRGDVGAAAAFSLYSIEGEGAVDGSPLETVRPSKRRSDALENIPQNPKKQERWKRTKLTQARFGKSAVEGDGSGLERVEVRLREVWPRNVHLPLQPGSGNAVKVAETAKPKGKGKGKGRQRKENKHDDEDAPEVDEEFPWRGKSWTPNIEVVLEGAHVFAGLRTLVEEGVLDGAKIPTWMTGEEGKSIGTVKNGTIISATVTGIQDTGKKRGRKGGQ